MGGGARARSGRAAYLDTASTNMNTATVRYDIHTRYRPIQHNPCGVPPSSRVCVTGRFILDSSLAFIRNVQLNIGAVSSSLNLKKHA
jgi:hypothetical protein